MKKMGEETRGGRGRRHFWGCGDADGGVLRSAVRQSAGFGGALETPQVPVREAPVTAQVLEPLLPVDTGPEKSHPPTREPACPLEESLLQYITHFWRNRRLKRSACI